MSLQKSKTIIIINFTLILCIVSSGFLALLCILLVLFKPQSLIFVGQLIPSKYFYFPVAFVVVLYHSYLMIALCTSSCIIGCVTLAYCFFVVLITRELSIGRRSYHSVGTLRSASNTVHVYRCLQILHKNVFYLCGPYLAAVNAIMMMNSIFVNFALIRYWGCLELLTKLTLIFLNISNVTFYYLMLQLGCLFYVGAAKMLRSWKHHKWSQSKFECHVMKAFQRSCRPILLSWENNFVLGRLSIFIYGRSVVKGTFRALLATK